MLREGIAAVPCYLVSRTETVTPHYSPDRDPRWSLIGTESRVLSWARMDCRPAKLEERRKEGLLGAVWAEMKKQSRMGRRRQPLL